jgi:nucleotide-binding universal stress UspA family protein
LVPTDFSPASEKAFSYALRFAGEPGAELTLLHVFELATPLTWPDRPAAAAFLEKELADTEENMRALADSAEAAGVSSSTRRALSGADGSGERTRFHLSNLRYEGEIATQKTQ